MQEIISHLEDCSEEQAQIIASIIDKYIKETTQPLQSRTIAIYWRWKWIWQINN